MAVTEDLSEDERYLLAILTDQSGIDLAEFSWYDPVEEAADDSVNDGCWRARPYQWSWWRDPAPYQIDQTARDIGKSLGIQARAYAFPYCHPGAELVVTAPELVHLEPLTSLIEQRFFANRLGLEIMPKSRSRITRRPFRMNFTTGSRIIGRIPQVTGRGVKGLHPVSLEGDEMQDYPEKGWVELIATLRRGIKGAMWRCHGVTRGLRDKFYEFTQPGPDNPWKVHRITAMHRPDWDDEERIRNIKLYGSRSSPDYRRNILGLHGDQTNALFVLHRMMKCFHKDTIIRVERDGRWRMMTLGNVQVGDHVANAVGVGRVSAVTPSCHSLLVRLGVDGTTFDCTPEHRILTDRGWSEAGALHAGDRLACSDLPGVRRADHGSWQEVLLHLVSRCRGASQAGTSLPKLWRRPEGWANQVLFLRLRRRCEASAAAVRRLRAVRCGADGNRSAEVLQHEMCLRPPSASSASRAPLRVRSADRVDQQRQILLEAVRREIHWADLPGLGYTEADVDCLRAMWRRVLPGVEEGALLQPVVRQPLHGASADLSRCQKVSGLRDEVCSWPRFAALLQHAVLVQAERDQAGRGRRPLGRTATTLARLGAWLVSRVLGVPVWGCGGRGELSDRPGQPDSHARGGGGWKGAPAVGGQGGRRHGARHLASFARVDSVEVLEHGDPRFTRLSGGKDQVECIDLTVSGHPSFAVGRAGIIVHNCVDSDEASTYNTTGYQCFRIRAEELEDAAGPLQSDQAREACSMLTFNTPAYDVYWAGADIGFTVDPTEILVAGEYVPSPKEIAADLAAHRSVPEGGATRLRIVARIHLERISNPTQAAIIRHVIAHFKPRAFGMDRTGAGMGLWQDVLATDLEMAKIIRGYHFSEKVIVGIDDTIEVTDREDVLKEAAVLGNVLEYATDSLRELVDTARWFMPWDREVLREFQGQTWCTDTETEILTKRGWLRFDEVRVGDDTLGIHDAEGTPVSSWNRIEAVSIFPAERRTMVGMKGQTHNSLTTANHRWLVKPYNHAKYLEWKTSVALCGNKRRYRVPMTAVRADMPGKRAFDDDFVELVAWFYTEGHRMLGGKIGLTQSPSANPACVARIEAMLVRLLGPGDLDPGRGHPGPGKWSRTSAEKVALSERHGAPSHAYRIKDLPLSAAVRGVAEGPHKVVSADFLTALTARQLDLFIDVSILGDGCEFIRQRIGRQGTEVRSFKQSHEGRTRAFEMACALRGIPTNTTFVPALGEWRTSLLRRRYAHSTSMRRTVVEHEGLVWCPTTASGTWLARRNGAVFFTGNSYSSAIMDAYGRRHRVFSVGNFHALDAARMLAMAHAQAPIEAFIADHKADNREAVLDAFVDF